MKQYTFNDTDRLTEIAKDFQDKSKKMTDDEILEKLEELQELVELHPRNN